ncbi:hypothetical protein HK405_012092 [Cladochytrium tenue]|nr:hypothetical protein HK405_012092 [Cladochytrium tenue]
MTRPAPAPTSAESFTTLSAPSASRAAARHGRSRIRPAAESARNDPPKPQQQSRALSLAGSSRRRRHPCRAASSSARPGEATVVSTASPTTTAAVRRSRSKPLPRQADTRVPSSACAAASAAPVQLGKALVAAAIVLAIGAAALAAAAHPTNGPVLLGEFADGSNSGVAGMRRR